ncbi:DnaJ domain-containing protein [bacterium]|nr:DnaJ domain-containing protein [bacterium]
MARLILVLAAAVLVYFWFRPPSRGAVWRGRLPLVAAAVLALAYVISPIDLLPDFSPLGLIDDLIVLVATGWWIHAQWHRRPRLEPAGPAGAPPGWDPHAVLEVERGASPDEISRAYREQMKRYHPDRVNGLGEELQRLAHQKTLEIQRAYAELRGR